MNREGMREKAADDHATVALEAFDPAFRGDLSWTQPRVGRRRWRFVSDERTFATLENRGFFGTGWRLRTAETTWAFRPRWASDVVAIAEGAAEPAARFRHGWFFSGRLERPGLPTLRWRRTSFWHDRWEIQTEDELPLVRFQARRRFLRLESALTIEDGARRLPDLGLLVAFGWMLLLRAHRSHSAGE